MSTPPDPQRGGQQPDQGPYGGSGGPEGRPPGSYEGRPGAEGGQEPGGYPQYGQQPPPYGQQPYGQPPPYGQPYQPYGQPYQPYGGDPGGQFAYNPYGQPYPAGTGGDDLEPPSRPGIMVLSLFLLILSTLPFLAFGALLLLVRLDASTLPPGLDLERQLTEAGITLDTLVSALRVVGGLALVLALLYITFAVLAFQGRNWARIALTVMTAGFGLLLLAGVFGGAAGDTGSLLVLLLILAASVGGTVILFLPEPSRYLTASRR